MLPADAEPAQVCAATNPAGGVGTVTAIPPAEFFARSPDLAAETATRSGFNPMLEDFWNTRIFLASGRGV